MLFLFIVLAIHSRHFNFNKTGTELAIRTVNG